VLHDLNQACRYATHLIALRDGKIVAEGAPKAIVTPDLIERIYGMRCMIIDDPVAGTPLVVPLGLLTGVLTAKTRARLTASASCVVTKRKLNSRSPRPLTSVR
jgi:energy-coupling factor transporter ATP-binding protein EcfA2